MRTGNKQRKALITHDNSEKTMFLSGSRLSNVFRYSIVLFLLLLGNAVQAVLVPNLYKATIPVADQSVEARNTALQQGLIRVTDRVTGNPDWRAILPEDELLKNTQRLLEQFGYQANDIPAQPPVIITVAETEDTGEFLPWQLNMTFSGAALESLLADYGVAVWGRNRPRVMFWIANDAGGRRQVVSESGLPDVVDDMRASLNYWGVPGLFPLMDLEDAGNLNVSDLWGFFSEPVELATARYNSDAVAMVRLYRDSAQRFKSLWQLRINGELVNQGEIESLSQKSWADQLVTAIAVSLADIYAVRVSSELQDTLQLDVANVQTFKDYVDVSRVLQSLAPVRTAAPVKVTPGRVRFAIELNGYKEQLIEYLALHDKISPSIATDPVTEEGNLLYYRWQP